MKRTWEPITLRPTNMPTDWKCLMQNLAVRHCETSFVRSAKTHHLGEPENIWVVFCEFNPEHWENETLKYKYTVRGGRNAKPSEEVKHFVNLKDATNYLIFLMESTDKWVIEVNSDAAIRAYEKRLIEIKKLTSRVYE